MNSNQSQPTHQCEETAEGHQAQGLDKRIVNWTSNLIATGLVIVVALVFGRQLITYWVPTSNPSSNAKVNSIMEAWPLLESSSVEFADSPFRLQRMQITGTGAQILEALKRQCETLIHEGAQPIGEMAAAEARLVERSASWTPVSEDPGKWRIFHMEPETAEVIPPTVVGLRDDCLDPETGKKVSRLVAWGLAFERGEPWQDKPSQPTDGKTNGYDISPNNNDVQPTVRNWTTFVCQAPSEDTARMPLPQTSTRTLAIIDTRGAEMIGFLGGSQEATMAHFERWAVENGWKMSKTWTPGPREGSNWLAKFEPNGKTASNLDEWASFQVRISPPSEDNEKIRGLIMIEPKTEAELGKRHGELIDE